MATLRQPPNDAVNRPYLDEVYGYITGLESRLQSMSASLTKFQASTKQTAQQQQNSLTSILTSPSAIATAVGMNTTGSIQDIFGNLANYPAGNFPVGTLFEVTDTVREGLWYAVKLVSGVKTWQYAFGTNTATRSTVVAYGLNVNDAGALFNVSDYAHIVQWDGSHYHILDGQGGWIASSIVSLTGVPGWHLCDGSATDYLVDNTTDLHVTAAFPVDETTAHAGLHHVSIASYTGAVNSPVDPTFSGTPANTGNDSASQIVQSGTGATVPAEPHTHGFTPNGLVIVTSDPTLNLGVLRYFRR